MKKFLLSLIAFVAVLGANAAEVVFDFTNPAGLNPAISDTEFVNGAAVVNDKVFTNGGVTVVATKGSTDSRLWKNSTGVVDLRTYKGSTLTVTAPAGEKIINITLAGGMVSGYTATVGAISNGIWDGNEASVVLTLPSTAKTHKIDKVTVKTVPEGTVVVSAPAMTPLGGYFYNTINVPVEISLKNNTPGAKVYYQIDAQAAVEYTAPFSISATCTVKAWAELQGTKSTVTEALFSIQDITEAADVDAFMALPKNTTARINSPVTVAFSSQSKGDTYVTSGGKVLLIYDKNVTSAHQYAAGDVIPAGIAGTSSVYNGGIQMGNTIVSTFGAATPGSKPTPVATTIAEATADKVNQYVIIYDATVDAGLKTLTVGAETLAMYNRYSGDGIAAPADLTKTYAVEGFLTSYKSKMQLYPIAFTDMAGVEGVEANKVTVTPMVGAVEIRGFEGVATVYNAAGQAVAAANVADGNSIALPAGFYIVKAGEKAVKVIVK